MAKPRAWRSFALASVCTIGLAGCETPYGLTVNEPNERAPARPAAILMSDPQIYARETLLNDRLRESQYLDEALKASRTAQFEPTIRRELRTLQDFSASLRGGIDTGAARDFERENEIKDLRQQAEIAKQQVDIAFYRRQMEALRSSAVTVPSQTQAKNDSAAADSEARDRIKKLEDTVAAIEKELKDKLEKLRNQSTDPDVPATRRSATQASPEEEYEDRKAFRERIRADLAAVSLDDLHDADGNGLYRLQFRATLLPGEFKDKYGVARLTLRPPALTDADVAKLYYTWLWHVARELNPEWPTTEGLARRQTTELYEALPVLGLYSLKTLRIIDDLHETARDAAPASKPFLKAPLPPGAEFVMAMISERRTDQTNDADFKLDVTAAPNSSAYLEYTRKIDMLSKVFVRGRSLIDALNNKISDTNSSNPQPQLGAEERSQLRSLALDAYCRPIGLTADPLNKSDRIIPDFLDALKIWEPEFDSDRIKNPSEFLNIAVVSSSYSIAVSTRNLRRVLVPVLGAALGSTPGISLAISEIELRIREIEAQTTPFLDALALANKNYWMKIEGLSESQAIEKLEDCVSVSQGRLNFDANFLSVPTPFWMAVVSIEPRSSSPQVSRDGSAMDAAASRQSPVVQALSRVLQEIEANRQGRRVSDSTSMRRPQQGEMLKPARGHAFAYATTPNETAQRLSTVASATRRLELALSLAATLPSSGMTANAAARFARSATGNIDAMERVPIVVGFSDRVVSEPVRAERFLEAPSTRNREVAPIGNDRSPTAAATVPVIGWVFGPPVGIDAKNDALKLHHRVVNHPVSSDVSVPSWWPWIEVDVETAWAGNWYGSGGNAVEAIDWTNSRVAGARTHKIFLPRARADLEGLTSHLAREIYGNRIRSTRIEDIAPKELNACAQMGRLLVFGTDLWRGAEVYLNGIRHKEISVLPDMSGISVGFDMRDVRESIARTKVQPQPVGGARPPPDPQKAVAEADDKVDIHVVTRSGRHNDRVTVVSDGTCAAPVAVRPTVSFGPTRAVVAGAEFRLKWSGARPSGASVQIGYRQRGSAWAKLTDAQYDATASELVVASVAVPDPAFAAAIKSGSAVDVGVVVDPGGGAPKWEAIVGSAVFFVDPAAATIASGKLESRMADASSGNLRIVLTPPAGVAAAYPALATAPLVLKATILGSSLTASATAALPDPSGRISVAVRVDQAKIRDWVAALAADQTVTLVPADNTDPGHPKVNVSVRIDKSPKQPGT